MRNVVVSLLVAIVAAFVTVQFTKTSPEATVEVRESVYDRVLRTGVIRCGYTFYSVALFKDESGQPRGIYKDLMDEIAKLLDLRIEWAEEVGWGEQIAGLNANRYDMVCSPANMTGPRARAADFITPFYYSPVYAWVREGDPRFGSDSKSNLEKANSEDIKIAAIDGEQSESQAKQFFPKAKLLSAPQSAPFSTMFMNVVEKKADITIAEPVSIREFMKENPDSKLVPINMDDPLILAVNIMMVNNSDPAFKAMVSNAITILIANGVVDNIIDKWEPYPHSYIRSPRIK